MTRLRVSAVDFRPRETTGERANDSPRPHSELPVSLDTDAEALKWTGRERGDVAAARVAEQGGRAIGQGDPFVRHRLRELTLTDEAGTRWCLRPLGAGAFGKVYAGEPVGGGENIAIK